MMSDRRMTYAEHKAPEPPGPTLPDCAQHSQGSCWTQISQHDPMTAEAIQQVSMAFKKALVERAMSGSWPCTLGA